MTLPGGDKFWKNGLKGQWLSIFPSIIIHSSYTSMETFIVPCFKYLIVKTEEKTAKMKGQEKLSDILDFDSGRNKIIRAMQLETCNSTYNLSFSVLSNHTQSCNVRLWSCLKTANIKQIKSETKYSNQFRGWFVSTRSC